MGAARVGFVSRKGAEAQRNTRFVKLKLVRRVIVCASVRKGCRESGLFVQN